MDATSVSVPVYLRQAGCAVEPCLWPVMVIVTKAWFEKLTETWSTW